MRSRIVFASLWGVALCASFGCSSAENQTITLGNADASRTVVAAVGDKVDVTLKTIGPGRYGDPSISSGGGVPR